MAAPSASGTGIINKPTAYGATSQVTSTNLNAHVDNAVFNANAVSSTINVGDDGKGLFVVDGSITTAKTSFLGTVDVTANSTVRILSKQSDGQYDSVTPSGDVTMSQAGSFTIANDAVTTDKILNSNVTLAKVANIADDRVLGNISGGAAAPSELTAANVVTLLGTNLINPASGIDNSTSSVTLSNGLIVKFGTFSMPSSGATQTVTFGAAFPNHIYGVLVSVNGSAGLSQGGATLYPRDVSTSGFEAYGSAVASQTGFYIAIGR
jgi:hypothetical protein